MGYFKKIALLKGGQKIEPPSYTFSSDLTELCHLGAYIENDASLVHIPVGPYDKSPYKLFEKKLKEFQYDFVGISAMTCGYNSAKKFAQIAKSAGAFVALGGYHPTALPEETLKDPNIDVIIRGEGELTLKEIVANGPCEDILGLSFKNNGDITHNPDRELIMDLDILPMPLRKIRPSRFGEGGDGYTIDSVFSSRGCIAKCTFCSNNTVNKTLRNRSPEHFVAELELLHDKNQRKVVKFWDSVFLFDPKRVERILELMFKKNLTNFKIVTESRSNDVIRCRHLLPELKRIGFHKLQIGIESPDPETLKKLKKGGSIAKHEEAIRLIKENGIKLEAFFIIGHPHETDKDIRKYPEYSDKLGIGHGALFFVMTPYPGTQIYQEYNAKSLIKSFEWDIYNNFGAVIQLDHVDRERLLDLLAYCYGRVQGIPHAFTKAKTIPRFIGMFLAFAFLWLLLYHIQTNRPEGKERFFEYLLEAGEGRYRKKRKRKALSKALGFLFAKVEFLFIVSEKKKLLFRFTMNKDTFELKTSYTERPKKRVLTLTLSDLDEVRQSIDIYDINAIMFLLQRKKRLLKEVPHFLPAIATTLRTLFVVGSRVGRRYFIG